MSSEAPHAGAGAAGEPGSARALAALHAVAAGARPRLLRQLRVLDEAVARLLEGRLDEASRVAAQRAAHQVAGSAGTFGLPHASVLARHLEGFFGGASLDDPGALLLTLDRLEALRQALGQLPAQTTGAAASQEGAVVLVAHRDADLAGMLSTAATAVGASTVWAPDLGAAVSILEEGDPVAVLVELDLPGGARALVERAVTADPARPAMVLHQEATLQHRVEAARLGVHGFLHVDDPPALIIETALEAARRAKPAPVRVLAVDDDPDLLDALQALLGSAGMHLHPAPDPTAFWRALTEATPDLVLLDLDMPGVTGLELCRLMRSDQRWATLPVLVLTASTGRADIEAVFRAGADDYVAKPFAGPELLTRIANRLERVRVHRRRAETDALTGLANRGKFESAFPRLCAMAQRHGQPLSFALLDVDSFKQVNDRHGHAVGDLVLRRLAAHLVGSLREEDLVARWGGEEMAVGMVGMRRTDAVTRLAEILERQRQDHVSVGSGAALQVTVSAGVAEYGIDGTDLHQLYRAADDALYEAKQRGGGRVLPAGWQQGAGEDVIDVLVVDDDPLLAGLLMEELRTHGLRAAHVTDGRQALRCLIGPQRMAARVVLLDVDLPAINGLDVLSQLSRDGVLLRTRVIMLTGRSGEDEVLTALREGAFDHVPKPFSVPVLMQRVRRALDTHPARR